MELWDHMVALFLTFEKPLGHFPRRLFNFPFPPTVPVYKASGFSTCLATLVSLWFCFLKWWLSWSPHHGSMIMNPTSIHENVGLILPCSGSGIAVSCGIGRRHGSDPTLLWLLRRPTATAPIQPLAWEPPYSAEAAQENGKKTNNNNNSSSYFKQWSYILICIIYNIRKSDMTKIMFIKHMCHLLYWINVSRFTSLKDNELFWLFLTIPSRNCDFIKTWFTSNYNSR